MHEQHQVQKLIDEIIAQAKARKLKTIKKVSVVMGEATGFDEGSVKLYFETLGEGTVLEGAEIQIRKVKAKLHCPPCNKDFEKQPRSLNCPQCGQQGLPTDAGKEFYAEKIEGA